MFTFFFNLYRFFRAIWKGLKDPEFRSLFILVIVILLSGTIFYHRTENFSWVDSLYFSVTTLATVGYGDLTPHTVAGKLFTIIYIFLGIGIFVGFINVIATSTKEQQLPELLHLFELRKGKDNKTDSKEEK